MQEHHKNLIHTAIMIACFVCAGISLLIFATRTLPLHNELSEVRERPLNESNMIPPNDTNRQERVRSFVLISEGLSLLVTIIFLLAGTSIFVLTRKKEKKELTKSLINSMTTDDEKMVLRALESHDGELTQSELVKRTGLSKVKIHRVIKRLESLKIIKKLEYGMTNKIVLEQQHRQ